MPDAAKIIYTKIDEAPALATHSLLPILQAYTKGSGIELESWDISLTGRIVANFPDRLTEEQRIPDYLTILGELTEDPGANTKVAQHQRIDPPDEGRHRVSCGARDTTSLTSRILPRPTRNATPGPAIPG